MQPNVCTVKKVKDDMSQPSRTGESGEAPRRRNDLPPEVLDIIAPALQVGGISGMLFLSRSRAIGSSVYLMLEIMHVIVL